MSQQASQTSASGSENLPADPIDRFLFVLDNAGKYMTDYGVMRTRGFVVLNRNGATADPNLVPLQQACFSPALGTRLQCLTVRYHIARLASGALFGTLIAAFLNDLKRVSSGADPASITGTFQPPLTDAVWTKLLHETPFREVMAGWEPNSTGTIPRERLDGILAMLANPSVLGPGLRLVLFAEVNGPGEIREHDPVAMWNEVLRTYLQRLPERMGIVLSDIPGIEIPLHDPHMVEINLATPSRESEGPTATRYADSPLHSDLPTHEDGVGIAGYARALARFVLHPQTKAPLTIGIHGPWGKGKSSFIEMIDRELVLAAPVNTPKRTPEFLKEEIELRNRVTDMRRDVIKARKRETDLLNRQIRYNYPKPEPLATEMEASFQKEEAIMRTSFEDTRRDLYAAALRNVISVRFNAWQFNDAVQTWAGLGSVITERMEKALPGRQRFLLRLEYAWKYHRAEVILNVLLPLILILLAVAVVLSLPGIQAQATKAFAESGAVGKLLAVLVPAGGVLLAVWGLAWRTIGAVQPISERVMGYMKRPDHKAQMGYQHRVLDDLRFVFRRVRRHYPDTKVVVYVDDLDRCSDEKIIELLQAVHLVLANCEYFVFLSMDTDMIHRAIRIHYTKNGQSDLPPNFPENYLRKIVQLSFHLPKTLPDRLYDLTRGLFSHASISALDARNAAKAGTKEEKRADDSGESADMPIPPDQLPYDMRYILHQPAYVEETVEDTPDELEAFGDYREFLMDNPRELKRLVNAHRLVKILLQGDGAAWPAARQRLLVKWLIFCSSWPDLVDDVLALARSSEHEDCVSVLADQLAISVDAREQLRRFATMKELLGSGTCRDFALAAQLIQIVKEEPAARNAEAA